MAKARKMKGFAAAQAVLLSAVGSAALLVSTAPAAAQSAPGFALTFLEPAPGETGRDTRVWTVSGDGRTVVGQSSRDFLTIWRNGVPELIRIPLNRDGLPAGQLINFSISADGNVITAHDEIGSGGNTEEQNAYIWTREAGFRLMPDIRPNERAVYIGGVSTDGRTLAITSLDTSALVNPQDCVSSKARCETRVYRWTSAGGYEAIGPIGPVPDGNGIWGPSVAAMSGDGRVLAGTVGRNTGYNFSVGPLAIDPPTAQRAWVWREGVGSTLLPSLSEAPNGDPVLRRDVVRAMSRDGTTIVGLSTDAANRDHAVFWRNNAVTSLNTGSGPIFATLARGVSSDGSVIVGWADDAEGRDTAFRWTAATGLQDLNQVVINAGLSLGGFRLTNAEGVSENGNVIVGDADNADSVASFVRRGFVLSLTQITRTQLVVRVTLPGTTQQSIVNQSFNTVVTGTLNGQTVFSRNVEDRIDSTAGAGALTAARAALQVGALRRLTIGSPTLLSSETMVLSTSNNTVNTLTGTSVTTATIISNGPTTVIAGDLGVCATPATNTALPTGCSLPGTTVEIQSGVTNSNIYTNTIESITPVTTPIVNQRINSRWQVAATAGNQFGTVHALVGPTAFDTGDRLMVDLLERGAARLPASDGRAAFGGAYGGWSQIDADTRVPVARVESDARGIALGLEGVRGALRAGFVLYRGATETTVEDPAFPETLKTQMTQLGVHGGWRAERVSLSGAASYGFGDVETAIATPTGPATASRGLTSVSIAGRAGYRLVDGERFAVTAVAGVRYATVSLEGFTETGGATPLIGLNQDVDRTRVFAGLESESRFRRGNSRVTGRLSARISSDSGEYDGAANLVFASAPTAPALTAVGPGVGETVGEIGASLEAEIDSNVRLRAGYSGSFRSGAENHAAQLGFTIRF